jgi:hypothetical protein
MRWCKLPDLSELPPLYPGSKGVFVGEYCRSVGGHTLNCLFRIAGMSSSAILRPAIRPHSTLARLKLSKERLLLLVNDAPLKVLWLLFLMILPVGGALYAPCMGI